MEAMRRGKWRGWQRSLMEEGRELRRELRGLRDAVLVAAVESLQNTAGVLARMGERLTRHTVAVVALTVAWVALWMLATNVWVAGAAGLSVAAAAAGRRLTATDDDEEEEVGLEELEARADYRLWRVDEATAVALGADPEEMERRARREREKQQRRERKAERLAEVVQGLSQVTKKGGVRLTRQGWDTGAMRRSGGGLVDEAEAGRRAPHVALREEPGWWVTKMAMPDGVSRGRPWYRVVEGATEGPPSGPEGGCLEVRWQWEGQWRGTVLRARSDATATVWTGPGGMGEPTAVLMVASPETLVQLPWRWNEGVMVRAEWRPESWVTRRELEGAGR